LAFQPAEEISYGAEAMIRDGVLERPKVDAAFGLNLWNDLPTGTIGIMPGAVMASVDEFEIAIVGRGGHAAAPHQTIDPVLVAAHVVTGLQRLVSRRRNPLAVAGGVRAVAGEEMSRVVAKLAGTLAYGGAAPQGDRAPPDSSPTVDIDEEALVAGAELRTRTVVRYLEVAR